MGLRRSSYTVTFTQEAALDLESIADFIAIDSPERARQVVHRIRTSGSRLKRWPRRFPIALEAAIQPTEELRQMLIGPYRVIFRVEPGRVEILHVRHAARRPLGADEI